MEVRVVRLFTSIHQQLPEAARESSAHGAGRDGLVPAGRRAVEVVDTVVE